MFSYLSDSSTLPTFPQVVEQSSTTPIIPDLFFVEGVRTGSHLGVIEHAIE